MPKCSHQNLPLPLYRSNTLPLLDLIIIQYLRLCTYHKDYHYAILSGLSVPSLLCPSTFPNSLLLNILSACTFPLSETKFCTHIKQHMVFNIWILLFTGSKCWPQNSKLNGGTHSVIPSPINFFMNVIFICYSLSQIFEFCHIFKWYVIYIYVGFCPTFHKWDMDIPFSQNYF